MQVTRTKSMLFILTLILERIVWWDFRNSRNDYCFKTDLITYPLILVRLLGDNPLEYYD